MINLRSRVSGGGEVASSTNGWTLRIPAGPSGKYRLSQVDDYQGLPRSKYAWRPPLTITLRARVSGQRRIGTWGFGLWNDPYGFLAGADGGQLRLPTLPQAAWFFGASPRSYLSLRDDMPANGFFAQVLRSSSLDASVLGAALALPFAPKTARKMLRRTVEEAAKRVDANPEAWRRYQMEWTARRVRFFVDEALVLDSNVSPAPPLGLVMWVDNQYAAFQPSGKIAWGVESSPEAAWMEIQGLEITT